MPSSSATESLAMNTYGADRGGPQRATGLALLGIGLGVAEIAAPGTLAGWVGARDTTRARSLLRVFGVREIANGIGILARPRTATGMWARVAGDALDLAVLAAVLASPRSLRGRAAASLVAIAGVAAIDVMVAKRLSRRSARQLPLAAPVHVIRTVTINRPPSELYQFWRDLKNLPRFIAHLEAVESHGRESTWRARVFGDHSLEWKAELTDDRLNESIAWRSLPGSLVSNRGEVRFVPAPGGRGTQLTVELSYDVPGGKYSAAFAKLFGQEPSQTVDSDLRRLKQILETGEVMRSDASIHRGAHPARPSAQRFEPGKGGL